MQPKNEIKSSKLLQPVDIQAESAPKTGPVLNILICFGLDSCESQDTKAPRRLTMLSAFSSVVCSYVCKMVESPERVGIPLLRAYSQGVLRLCDPC
jgi:hypothetical protein